MPIQRFDRAVDGAFERLRGHPALDRLFYGASALGEHGMIWIMAASAQGLRSNDRWRATMRMLAGIPLESLAVNGGVKSLFRRGRPVVDSARPLPLRIPLTSSFPSGHASSAFFSASLLSERDPGLAPLYYAVATVISASRIYVKMHHASDVVAGAVLGSVLGCVARRVVPLQESPAGRRC